MAAQLTPHPPDYNEIDQDAPIGLKQLAGLERLLVKRRLPNGVSPGYCYDVITLEQTLVFKAEEQGAAYPDNGERAFKMVICDAQNKEVIRLVRPHRWTCSKMVVSMLGQQVAIVREKPTFFDTVLLINDTDDLPILNIKGQWSSDEYELRSACRSKRFIGRVAKLSAGYFRDLNYGRDGYYIQFPLDLDVNHKAVVIGAAILLDFMKNYASGSTLYI